MKAFPRELVTYQYRNYMLITGVLMIFILIIPNIPVLTRKKSARCPVTKGLTNVFNSWEVFCHQAVEVRESPYYKSNCTWKFAKYEKIIEFCHCGKVATLLMVFISLVRGGG